MLKIDQEARIKAEREARAFAERQSLDGRLVSIENKLDQLLKLVKTKSKD